METETSWIDYVVNTLIIIWGIFAFLVGAYSSPASPETPTASPNSGWVKVGQVLACLSLLHTVTQRPDKTEATPKE